MKFADFVIAEAIEPALTASDEAGAIQALVKQLQVHGAFHADSLDAIVHAVLERESLGTTALGHRAALPHANHSAVARCVGTVGVSHQGIDFHSVDNEQVHLIFLVLSPPESRKDHLKALEWIARHLRNQTFCRLLQEARTAEEIQELLQQADEQRFV